MRSVHVCITWTLIVHVPDSHGDIHSGLPEAPTGPGYLQVFIKSMSMYILTVGTGKLTVIF